MVRVDVSVDPHETQRADLGEVTTDELLVVTIDGIRATALGGVDLDFVDAPASFEIAIESAPGGIRATVTAASLMRDTCLMPGSIDDDAHCDRNLITLLPGEAESWMIRTDHPERFTEESLRPVVYSARAATTLSGH